jgi:diguanylate cyclase (GGDEF)-like protein
MTQNKLTDEAGRLASLRRYDVLDTAAETPFDKITQLVKTVLNVPIVAVSLIDADRQWFKSCVGLEVRETARDISFCTHTIQSRKPMVIGDAKRDPKFAYNPLVIGPPYIGSYAGAPLLAPDGYVLGSLCAIDTEARQFTDVQIEVLQSFAALVVDEFELRRLSHSDSTTGALSRRALLTEAERAVSHFTRHNMPSALVSFDIDGFSHVNAAYGFAVGDTVLRTIATRINEQSRPGDILARLGGDEFSLLLTGTDLAQAELAAERARAAVESLTFAHDPALRVTASFGVAALTPACATSEQLLADADLALEAAKQGGGNRYSLLPEPEVESDDEIFLLRREDESEAEADLEEDLSEDEEEFELHRLSVEPLSRSLWTKVQRLKRVRTVKTGRLAYGGLHPGIVTCKIVDLTQTGIRVESFAKLSPMPECFSVEFSDIYCRARMAKTEGFEIDLEFIFDGA